MPVAVITGASRGFGRAIARDLAADGWTLVIDAQAPEALLAAAAPLGAAVVAIAGDITDPAHRSDLVATGDRLGGIDLLINNASALGPSPLPALRDLPLGALFRIYDVNVFAPLALIQQALPYLSSDGAIVNLTSDAAIESYAGWGGYGSAKAALDQLTSVFAAECPELSWYAFDPGDMRTDLHQAAFPGEDISDRPEPETVVPALRLLLSQRPPSGRYRHLDFESAAVSR